ncbi:MAG: glutamate-5-semialdehyde dehydrogenase [Acidimicrobiaceae bacterium]|nr:glutamate-5-semialdehyde dehydrogenase [Acidimicrobiaceae bacterium]
MIQEVTPILTLAKRAKTASRKLAVVRTETKDSALHAGADRLLANTARLQEANAVDVAEATAQGMATPLIDRLLLDRGRIEAMANGLRQVASLADPVGRINQGWVRPNGLQIERMHVPLGVVAIIYEGRPNVTSDAFGLCLKSGNAAFLRGSSSAINSNLAIAAVLREALEATGLPVDALVMVDDTRRQAALEFMQQDAYIDCLIPRGGPALIQSILDNATVPYVLDGAGNCHVYVDSRAELDMALKILINAKTQRTGVCNAAESLVLHRDIAAEFLPQAIAALVGVEWVGDSQACEISAAISPAAPQDFATEFLSMKMSVKVVDSLAAAIEHIRQNSTGHSEAIVTNDMRAAQRFVREVDAAAVLVNASTRFVDGEEFGFGAEIGISTQKLHARGPMGLEQLTTTKYVLRGDGHVRA